MNNHIQQDTAEAMRDEMVMKDKILLLLNESPGTVPQIAESLECSTHNVMLWIMAMWRYGSLEEVGKPDDEGYYHYRSVL